MLSSFFDSLFKNFSTPNPNPIPNAVQPGMQGPMPQTPNAQPMGLGLLGMGGTDPESMMKQKMLMQALSGYSGDQQQQQQQSVSPTSMPMMPQGRNMGFTRPSMNMASNPMQNPGMQSVQQGMNRRFLGLGNY